MGHTPQKFSKGKESLRIAKAIVTYSKIHDGQLYFNDVLSGLVSFALARHEDENDDGSNVENTDVAMKLLNDQRQRKLPRSVTRADSKLNEASTSAEIVGIDTVI